MKTLANVNYYYDIAQMDSLRRIAGDGDIDCDLAHLCHDCSLDYTADQYQLAGAGDDDLVCEICGASNNVYDRAADRVANSEALRPHTDFVLADWHEGDEHWQWVVDAKEADILDWVAAAK